MPLPNAFPLFVDPYLRDSGIAVFEGTVSSGTVTKVGGLCTCGNFTSGVAAVTFPKCKKAIALSGTENTDSDTAGNNHDLVLVDVNPTAGTANLRARSFDASDSVAEAPADGTITFTLLLSW